MVLTYKQKSWWYWYSIELPCEWYSNIHVLLICLHHYHSSIYRCEFVLFTNDSSSKITREKKHRDTNIHFSLYLSISIHSIWAFSIQLMLIRGTLLVAITAFVVERKRKTSSHFNVCLFSFILFTSLNTDDDVDDDDDDKWEHTKLHIISI